MQEEGPNEASLRQRAKDGKRVFVLQFMSSEDEVPDLQGPARAGARDSFL